MSSLYAKINEVTTRNNVDLFIQKLINPEDTSIVLSDAKQKELERMHKCLELIKLFVSRVKVVPKLMNQFSVSKSEAYRIYEDTLYVFDSVFKRRQGREVHVDILVSNIMDTYRKALESDDLKNATYAMRLYLDAIKEFYGGHEAEMYANLQPADITFIIPERVLKIETNPDLKARIIKELKPTERNTEAFDEYIDREKDTD